MFLISVILITFSIGVILFNQKSNVVSKIGMSSIIFSLSYPALFYKPLVTDDMYRYFQDMKILSSISTFKGMLEAFNTWPQLLRYKYNVIFDYLEWIIARTGHFNILPFLSVMIFYIFLLIPFSDIISSCKANSVFLFFITMAVIVIYPYGSIINTVRWFMAASMVSFITINYLNYDHRMLFLLLYLVPVYIHPAIKVPIAVILFAIFLLKRNKNHIKIYLSYLVVFYLFTMYINHLIQTGNTQSSTDIMAGAIYYFQSNNVQMTFLQTVGLWLRDIAPFLYALGTYAVIRFNKYKFQDVLIGKFINVWKLMVVFDISFINEIVILDRFSIFVSIFSIYILIYAIYKKLYIPFFTKFLYSIGLIIFIFEFIYLTLNNIM